MSQSILSSFGKTYSFPLNYLIYEIIRLYIQDSLYEWHESKPISEVKDNIIESPSAY